MNGKLILTAALLPLFCTLALAQPGVIKVHPAGPADGKILTMEESITSRTIYPQRARASWHGDDEVLLNTAEGTFTVNAATGEKTPYKSQQPQGGKNYRKDGWSAAVPGPAGNVAVTKGKSLYYLDSEGNAHSVAESENDQIVYGQTVSRNEFGISGGIFWSPDGSKLAFYRKDESRVTDFPLLDITTRTGSLKNIKYPMAGMDSERISLGIFNISDGSTVYVKADDFGEDRYLTNVTWSPDGKFIYIQVLDRSQKHCRLNLYDAADGSFIKTILTEDSDKYVEPLDPLYFIKGSDQLFIYRTANRDGYRNLYLCDNDGNILRITTTDADVEYLANDGKNVFYTSAEVSPVENHLFCVTSMNLLSARSFSKIKFGRPVRKTRETGWHSIQLSPDMKHYIDSYSSFNEPYHANLCDVIGNQKIELAKSDDPLASYATGEVDFGTVKSADGQYDNYYRLFKPKDFDPSKKYPVVVYVYGGPHSQMVQDTWLGQMRIWEMYMAQRGYLVYVQDNRGTQNRGLAYEQAIHRQCGQVEMQDQMVGVNMLKSLPYVDSSRIGVHGWSYGGFMTISLITNYPDTFKVAVAGGPVIDWKWYEIMYGERYMDTPQTNPEGFAKTSLINKAKDLKGKLLICQGAIDNTVVWEHSLSFVRECIKNNVQVDYFPYPCAEHNVAGKDRIHLMDKVSMYFFNFL